MEKSEKIIIKIFEHTFLDCSKGWFVKVNNVKSGGEITSLDEAITYGNV